MLFILFLEYGMHSPDIRCATEIKNRKALSKDTFTKMKYIFTNRNIIGDHMKLITVLIFYWNSRC